MKPKTKHEKLVVQLSKEIPGITLRQKQWAFDYCIPKEFRISRNRYYCLECGHKWKEEVACAEKLSKTDCPSCGKHLVLRDNQSRTSRYYAGFMTTFKGFQVFRIALVSKWNWRLGDKAEHGFCEVIQHWIDKDGKYTFLCIEAQSFCIYYDSWRMATDLEPRMNSYNNSLRKEIVPWLIHPNRKYIPELKRNGFNGRFYNLLPQWLLSNLLSNPKVELLFKEKQFNLLGIYDQVNKEIVENWSSIRICLRNNYIIRKPKDWLDHIRLLNYFGKDILSPKYVCPKDFQKDHQRYIKKRLIILREENARKNQAKILALEESYQKDKGEYLKIKIQENCWLIRPLQSVNEFREESDEMGHCVFTNNYFEKKDSLIMTAQLNKKRIETVEISLTNFMILDSRGSSNLPTKYHDKILELVKNNMEMIKNIQKKDDNNRKVRCEQ